jgi:primary-amine oxidase
VSATPIPSESTPRETPGSTQSPPSPRHPLDPLSAGEISRLVAVLARAHGVGAGWRYASIELVEPGKAALAGAELPAREGRAVCWSTADGLAHRAVVRFAVGDPGGDRLVSWEDLPGVQPNMTVDEWHECDELARRDPRLVAALARRGVTDLGLVLVDTWAYGAALVPERYRGRRLGWSDVWVRDSPTGNPYANPLGGLHPVIDLNTMTVLEIEDDDRGPSEHPGTMGEYDPALTGLPERALQPLEITQPEGVSFTLDGNLLTWQNWQLRVGFSYREGLVLHTVGYQDPHAPGGPRLRPVAHRLSFAEMVVPYRDPSPDHHRRTAFDIGEWGLGFMTTSLTLGCDCLGEIRYLDAVLHDSHGTPYTIKNAICIHEEDNAVLWKHVDPAAGTQVRRARRLVVSFHVTVANYEYLVYWRFYQDGSIECEVRATGIMVTTRYDGAEPPPYGVKVDQQTYAPIHQHFVVARLDLDVDGEANSVLESHTEALPVSAENPHGLALVARSVPLRTEREAVQDVDFATQRAWKVVNPGRLNGLGQPVGYKLVPGAAIPAQFDPSSPVLARAGVIGHTLWVTPQHPEERWPAGEFPTQGAGGGTPGGAGLPEWTAADRPIENTDVVLWYVFGIHHVPRPEDWPVMPVDTISFWLKPFGFFDRNPALDVPPSPMNHGDHCH